MGERGSENIWSNDSLVWMLFVIYEYSQVIFKIIVRLDRWKKLENAIGGFISWWRYHWWVFPAMQCPYGIRHQPKTKFIWKLCKSSHQRMLKMAQMRSCGDVSIARSEPNASLIGNNRFLQLSTKLAAVTVSKFREPKLYSQMKSYTCIMHYTHEEQ